MDTIMWEKEPNVTEDFSTKTAWDSLRNSGQEVDWYRMVWSSFSIPRHAFLCWLICRRKLAMQDRIQMWNNAASNMNLMSYLLCNRGLESHEHLFFECPYSSKIWCSLRAKVDMSQTDGKWDDVLAWLILNANSKLAIWVIRKLVVAAIAYYVWQERNARFFNNQLRPPEKLEEQITETVRLKLHSFKFKSNEWVTRLLKIWKISSLDEADTT
ncbi:uncharacterized protein LOC110933722 [Helianthus annuus]|uniref:uncharacterized protein LOC110933722 n=1 Tax=Helianthus annuus TaxID=4232 RepID=UPI000B8F23FE|nr:uncharacterized protein LOC110933722 [Helianthus annuus]